MSYPLNNHPVISQMAQLNLTGDVIPRIWNRQLVRPDGKPYDIAIRLLADIVFWYRPVEVFDEVSGKLVEFRKRFKADKLQRDYAQFGEEYGYSKNQVRDALAFLQAMKLIDIEFRHPYVSGRRFGNVLYIGLNADRIREITYPAGMGVQPAKPSVEQLPLFLPGESPDWETIEPREALKLPELMLYRAITGRMPGRPQYPLIYEAVHTIGLKRDKIEPFWKAHITRGGKPEALYWLTEWAVSGKVSYGQNGHANGNGTNGHPPEPVPRGQTELDAWLGQNQAVHA